MHPVYKKIALVAGAPFAAYQLGDSACNMYISKKLDRQFQELKTATVINDTKLKVLQESYADRQEQSAAFGAYAALVTGAVALAYLNKRVLVKKASALRTMRMNIGSLFGHAHNANNKSLQNKI